MQPHQKLFPLFRIIFVKSGWEERQVHRLVELKLWGGHFLKLVFILWLLTFLTQELFILIQFVCLHTKIRMVLTRLWSLRLQTTIFIWQDLRISRFKWIVFACGVYIDRYLSFYFCFVLFVFFYFCCFCLFCFGFFCCFWWSFFFSVYFSNLNLKYMDGEEALRIDM